MNLRTCLVWPFIFFLTLKASGQNYAVPADSLTSEKPEFTLSGFADIFYAFDFDQPETNYRQPFLYNHNRHNEFNLNLGLLKAEVTHQKFRANLALQAGTYPMDNYAAEPASLQLIHEANAGVALSGNNKLWLDAGILPSHIGFESAVSIDNPTLTRSMLAENSPYYLAGARLSYGLYKKFEIAALICNGWQRIQRVAGNSLPSFGTQLVYYPTDKLKLNWSTFAGTDDPDINRRMRFFNNFYGQLISGEKLELTVGFDIGIQQKQKGSRQYSSWLSPVLISRYKFNKNWAAAFRAEYYADPDEVIIETATQSGFISKGISINIDYEPQAAVMLRCEARWLGINNTGWAASNKAVSSNFFIVSSLVVRVKSNVL